MTWCLSKLIYEDLDRMHDDLYAKQKLDFVSNLNGTTLGDVVSQLASFSMISFLGVMVKLMLVVSNAAIVNKFW